jgi:acetyltransferase
MARVQYTLLDDARPLPSSPLSLLTGLSCDKADGRWLLNDRTAISIRAARPDDTAMLQILVRGLSLKSRHLRFFHAIRELLPDLLAQFTRADPTQEMSLLALIQQDGQQMPVAMAQYVSAPYPERCDFAVVVADMWQRHGIGIRPLRNLICIASAAGLEMIEGDVLDENEPIRQLMKDMGFTLAPHPDGPYLMKAFKPLAPPAWKCYAWAALLSRGRVGGKSFSDHCVN